VSKSCVGTVRHPLFCTPLGLNIACVAYQPPRQPKPDRDRLLSLISAFDSESEFGVTTPLNCPYELREVYALLTTYLFALPEPILSSEMFEAMWAWCVLPSLRSTDFLEDDNRVRRHAPTDAGIHIAQLLLRLLPLPNFSLIVYMMGFFQRLPHMVGEDVGRAVFAGRCADSSNTSDGRAERAETMLRWLLDRWDAIFQELFPPHELQQMETTAAPEISSSPPAVSKTRPDPEFTPRVRQMSGGESPCGKLVPNLKRTILILISFYSPAHAATLRWPV
jgi:hypothetical protein